MSGLRLDLIARTYLQDGGYKSVDRWTWRLWSGSKIVSTSGKQLYSRRIDCARGAEVGAGVGGVVLALKMGDGDGEGLWADRWGWHGDRALPDDVAVRIIDERAKP